MVDYPAQYGEHHPLVAESWLSLDQVDMVRNDFRTAEPKLAHAAEILRDFRGADDAQTEAAYALWATALLQLGAFEDAERALQVSGSVE